MLEKSPLKSIQLLLDQVENLLQRCCRNLLRVIPCVEEWALGVSQGHEPQSLSVALKGAEEKEWRLAIDSELASLE